MTSRSGPPIRSCWTSRSDVRLKAPCPFPHQMELSQTSTVRPERELPSNADADESPNAPNAVIYDFWARAAGHSLHIDTKAINLRWVDPSCGGSGRRNFRRGEETTRANISSNV